MRKMEKEYENVAVGGTFDELHKGHKTLLLKAFEVGEHILIGLCSDEFAKKLNKPHKVAPYDDRLKDLKAFLLEHGWLERAQIVRAERPLRTDSVERTYQRPVVSEETAPTATEINRRRKQAGLSSLEYW